jgi:hypothetical protein
MRITLATRTAAAPSGPLARGRRMPELSGKTDPGHWEPGHIFTGPGRGFRASPLPGSTGKPGSTCATRQQNPVKRDKGMNGGCNRPMAEPAPLSGAPEAPPQAAHRLRRRHQARPNLHNRRSLGVAVIYLRGDGERMLTGIA